MPLSAATAIRAGGAFVEIFADARKLLSALARASAALKTFGATIRQIGQRILTYSTVVGANLALAIRHTAKLGDQLTNMAERTGLAVEELSALSILARLADRDISDLEPAIRRLQVSLANAAAGGAEARETFARLGLAAEDLLRLRPWQQLQILADAFRRIQNPAERAALAVKLFGRSGTGLLPLLGAGGKVLEEFRQRAEALGLVVSTKDAAAMATMERYSVFLRQAFARIVETLGVELLPVLRKLNAYMLRNLRATIAFVGANKGWILSLAQLALLGPAVAGGLILTGAAVTSLSKILSIVTGATLAAHAALTNLLRVLLSVKGVALVAGAAAIGFAAKFVSLSRSTQLSATFIARQFASMKAEALDTIHGITAALASGRIDLAAQLFWAALQLAWARGTSALAELWYGALAAMQGLAVDAWHGILATATILWRELQVGFARTISWIGQRWESLTGILAKGIAFIAYHEQYSEMFRVIDEITERAQDQYAELEQRRIAEAEQWADRQLAEIGARNISYHAELLAKQRERVRTYEQQIQTAAASWRRALSEVSRASEPAPGAPATEPLPVAPNRWASMIDELDGALTRTAAKVEAQATFSSAALLGLQAGGMQDRIAAATERTAEGVERLREQLRELQQTYLD